MINLSNIHGNYPIPGSKNTVLTFLLFIRLTRPENGTIFDNDRTCELKK